MKADFGDGYTQTVPDGLNFIRRTIALQWDLLTPDQAATFDAFFTAQCPNPFYYTSSNESTPVKWTCEDWSWTVIEGGYRKFTVSLEQSFNTGT